MEQIESCAMGFIKNQNRTLDFVQTDITFREVSASSSDASSTIIVLGVMTFALQLCLALLCMLRCWRLERRVQEALKQTDSVHKLSELPYFYPDGYKKNTYLLHKDPPGTPSHATSSAMEKYEDPKDSTSSPALPWDLVQH